MHYEGDTFADRWRYTIRCNAQIGAHVKTIHTWYGEGGTFDTENCETNKNKMELNLQRFSSLLFPLSFPVYLSFISFRSSQLSK